MKTKHGPEAQEGDYVLILNVDYWHQGQGQTYIGRVYKNKIYTGIQSKNKFIHKNIAEIVISENIVPQETKELIKKDIDLHNNLLN